MKFATANNQEEDIWKILARNEILKTSKQALKKALSATLRKENVV